MMAGPGDGAPGGREAMALAARPFLKLLSRQPRWCPHPPAFQVPPGGLCLGQARGSEFAGPTLRK